MDVLLIADEESALELGTSFMWVRETPQRRKIIEEFWASGAGPLGRVTLFRAQPNASPEQACAEIIDSIVLHHPNMTSLEIVGARLTEQLLRALPNRNATSR